MIKMSLASHRCNHKLSTSEFDFDELFLQALIIFIGGVESTASTMTWIFYELAKNQEMQDRCREEVMDVVKRTGSPLKLDQQNEIPTVLGAINGE